MPFPCTARLQDVSGGQTTKSWRLTPPGVLQLARDPNVCADLRNCFDRVAPTMAGRRLAKVGAPPLHALWPAATEIHSLNESYYLCLFTLSEKARNRTQQQRRSLHSLSVR